MFAYLFCCSGRCYTFSNVKGLVLSPEKKITNQLEMLLIIYVSVQLSRESLSDTSRKNASWKDEMSSLQTVFFVHLKRIKSN